MSKTTRWRAKCLFALMGAITLCMVLTNLLVGWRFRADCYDSVDDLPHSTVILVLGSHPKSWYLKKRLDAASELYHQGKGTMVLVSGGSDGGGYDEAAAMKEMLMDRGVPESAILGDKNGYRTLDSVIRAKEIFHCDRVVMVSQVFHNPRALYFAHFCGLNAVAYNAETPPYPKHWTIELREVGARCMAFWHLHVTGERPLSTKR